MNVLTQVEALLDALEDSGQNPESVMVLMEDIVTWLPWCHLLPPSNSASLLISMEHTYTKPTRAAILARKALKLPGRVQAVTLIQQGFLGVVGRSAPRPAMLLLIAEPSGKEYCLLRQNGGHTQEVSLEEVEFQAEEPEEMTEMLRAEMRCLMSLAQAMSLNGMNWDM